jgi:hypothetical protein
MSQTVENISQMFSNYWIKESINFGKSVTSNSGKKKKNQNLYNNSELQFLTVCCSCVFADCSFTLGSVSPNNTAGTNALKIYTSNLSNF